MKVEKQKQPKGKQNSPGSRNDRYSSQDLNPGRMTAKPMYLITVLLAVKNEAHSNVNVLLTVLVCYYSNTG